MVKNKQNFVKGKFGREMVMSQEVRIGENHVLNGSRPFGRKF